MEVKKIGLSLVLFFILFLGAWFIHFQIDRTKYYTEYPPSGFKGLGKEETEIQVYEPFKPREYIRMIRIGEK